MNLENFPTREMAKDMMSMISPIYEKSYVGKWIFEVMSVSLALARQTVDDLMNEGFPETTTWAISMWEQEYGITPNESLSLEERRRNLVKKRNYRRPMNPWRIEQLVKDITGRDDVKLLENVEPHTYEIVIGPGDSKVDIEAVYNAVYNVKQSQKQVRLTRVIAVAAKVHVGIGLYTPGRELALHNSRIAGSEATIRASPSCAMCTVSVISIGN